MRHFGERHDPLDAELQALRSEPREEFVRELSAKVGTASRRRGRTLRATASAVLAGAALVALGGLAFAGGGGGEGAGSERNPRSALYPGPGNGNGKLVLCHLEAEGGGQGVHYIRLELPPAAVRAHLREHDDDVLVAVDEECPPGPTT